MIQISTVIVLLCAILITYPISCLTLQCYQCSGRKSCGYGEIDHVVNCSGKCLTYLDENNHIKRCCSDDFHTENNQKVYVCSTNKCNGIGSEKNLNNGKNLKVKIKTRKSPISIKTETSTPQSLFTCYDCSGLNDQSCTTTTSNCPMCMVYRNDNDQSKFDRRCCWWACGTPNEISQFSGRPTYFCNADKCNGQGSEAIFDSLNPTSTTTPPSTTSLTSTIPTASTQQTSFQCYDCSGPECGKEGSSVSFDCPSCMIYRNPDDQTKIERRCCWWACGSSNSISNYNGLETYFCARDKCNGYGAEFALSPPKTTTTTATTIMTTATSVITGATTLKTSFQCYECSGTECGKGDVSLFPNCPSCMIYRNTNDPTIIERRCCWWGCGSSNTISEYNGIDTYFCTNDKCNGYGAEYVLPPPKETTIMTTVTAPVITTTAPPPTSSQCYDCSGPECGKEGSTVSVNCPSCMVYRNPDDQTKIERRCCWWACGPSNSIGIYNGMETYFCAGNKCNGYGAEFALSPPVTTKTTTAITQPVTATTITQPVSTIVITTTAPQPTSSQCYDCSGPECGKEGSTVSMNCPSCMVYRNPDDQTKIERRCCWWACGAHNTVSMYNGMETYFCTGDKCNGYGAEFVLRPPVTTTTASTTATASASTVLSTATSSTSCSLNCQNGGTPETEDGCFCYCLENTKGRECEIVDCAQPDVDPDTCSLENQPLCAESENFAFECLHLCGKC